ncbi:MAG: hypothetical protein N2381_11240, partial [Armatimonadetes bacterium]|nr:hypothetical protein [Armatimonadota bacterium]
ILQKKKPKIGKPVGMPSKMTEIVTKIRRVRLLPDRKNMTEKSARHGHAIQNDKIVTKVWRIGLPPERKNGTKKFGKPVGLPYEMRKNRNEKIVTKIKGQCYCPAEKFKQILSSHIPILKFVNENVLKFIISFKNSHLYL